MFCSLGDIPLDMEFIDPALDPGPAGRLAGTIWADVALVEYIQRENVGGPDPLVPDDWCQGLGFDDTVLFGGDDIVTLGNGKDVLNDPGGALQASLGAGDDVANLCEQLQGVTDEKFVDADDGNGEVHYENGNGTILGGAGNDLIADAGNSDGTWVFNGCSGKDTIHAKEDSRIEDDKGSRSDRQLSPGGPSGRSDVVLSYASATHGIVVDLPGGIVSGGGLRTDQISGIWNFEGTSGNDAMTGVRIVGGPSAIGVRFWGTGGGDTAFGGGSQVGPYGGSGGDVIDGCGGDDHIGMELGLIRPPEATAPTRWTAAAWQTISFA